MDRVTAVWLVAGAQASGKSTVADLLARRFDRGAHVRGGQFQRWAVLGLWLDTSAQTPSETVDQILARAAEARVA